VGERNAHDRGRIHDTDYTAAMSEATDAMVRFATGQASRHSPQAAPRGGLHPVPGEDAAAGRSPANVTSVVAA
jgi:hypothetical protein